MCTAVIYSNEYGYRIYIIYIKNKNDILKTKIIMKEKRRKKSDKNITKIL